jgi:septum formation protein
MALILASGSPRRRELLRAAGIAFEVQTTDIPEIPGEGEPPRVFAERLARDKALAVAVERPQDWVLGADTIVVVDGTILGKPNDAGDAARMLRQLSGRWHDVITAVCLTGLRVPRTAQENAGGATRGAGAHGVCEVRSETTLVRFAALSDQDIADYVATGEPLDKAGAYAIQGIASRWIPRIEGDYANVVGLPVALVWEMLREQGIHAAAAG